MVCALVLLPQTEVLAVLMTNQPGSLHVGWIDLALRWRLHPETVALSSIVSKKGKSMDSSSLFQMGGLIIRVHVEWWGWSDWKLK